MSSRTAITFNDQHAGQAGNFSPDKSGTGRVNIYWYYPCVMALRVMLTNMQR